MAKAEKSGFQTEVSRLLDIVANALYSNREVFLRELISNAADACDKLRHAALTQPELTKDDAEFKIRVSLDKDKRQVVISDNGIGMSRDEMKENLGTIARSGTAAFIDQLKASGSKDVSQIGQFGVGFYSAFTVADKVSVVSRKAGEEKASTWVSEGKGEFELGDGEKATRGTKITLHMREDADEYLESVRLQNIIKTYSDHISLPIIFVNDKGEDEQQNAASALWTRSKKDITEDQYKEFYHHVAHAFDEPMLTMHWKVEGVLEFTNLLFVPSNKPFDLYDPERKNRLKLYVKRIFITDNCEDLLPSYLRFVQGVVDAEMLQNNPRVAKMRAAIVKRVLGDLAKMAKDRPEDYIKFWDTFGGVLKEGICEDMAHKDDLLGLMRVKATETGDAWTTLDEYLTTLKPGQESIYYITGSDAHALSQSPQVEGYKAKGVNVLLLTDPVDEFWLQMVENYKDKKFVSVARGATDLEKIKGNKSDEKAKEEAAPEAEVASLVEAMKKIYGERVKDVRTTDRLTDSPVCLVADDGEMNPHLQMILRQHNKLDDLAKPILEVNPKHALIKKLAGQAGEGAETALADPVELLLDQALILDGKPPKDPVRFAKRLSDAVARGLA